MLHIQNSEGRKVSVLNDDDKPYYSPAYQYYSIPQRPSYNAVNALVSQPYHSGPVDLARSESSSSSLPHTPQLLRSDSYDSQASGGDPLSPMTPNLIHADYARSGSVFAADPGTPFEEWLPESHALVHTGAGSKRPAAFDRRSVSYEDVAAPPARGAAPAAAMAPLDRAGKRYPCRYRDTHGCEKTFTTSGHASRHSKIHTAEKAVLCTHNGCSKKFTRADNMKQHLETHYKDKTRSSTGRRASCSANSRHGSRHGGHHSTNSFGSSASSIRADRPATPMASDSTTGSFDARRLTHEFTPRPSTVRTQSIGLDTLAAIACQESA